MLVENMKIYVAGPYTAPTEAERKRNLDNAARVGFELFLKGHYPLVPHLTHYIDLRGMALKTAPEWEDYMRCDLAWLKVSDALFFIGSSRGADIELEEAKRSGLKIFYSLDEVPYVGIGGRCDKSS